MEAPSICRRREEEGVGPPPECQSQTRDKPLSTKISVPHGGGAGQDRQPQVLALGSVLLPLYAPSQVVETTATASHRCHQNL